MIYFYHTRRLGEINIFTIWIHFYMIVNILSFLRKSKHWMHKSLLFFSLF